ncbi:hypothetical protein LUX32_49065 [Actinomadura madurae]|nr:hypothetical protein [Actinomadura madurae]MCP9984605.1 hypothetical protein [Actinomadura madurae]
MRRSRTRACATSGSVRSTSSISAGSIRYPRILIWSSARPWKSSMPSGRRLARSPVRYMREPSERKGSATNRAAVRPGRRRYPRASPCPETNSSPTEPTGAGRRRSSSTYARVLRIGRPMGGLPAPGGRRAIVAHTVLSVGP